MNIRIFRPQNIILQNFIEFFYTLSRNHKEETETYLTFPNIYSMVSICRNTNIRTTENKITVEYCKENQIISVLAVKYLQPLLIEYIGAANEITICFKPLGLSAFIDNSINQFTMYDGLMARFSPFDDYFEKMNEIMLIQADEEKIAAMETYWIGKLRGINHPFLYQVLNDILLPNNQEMSIAEMASKNGITQKTLIKHFENYIGKTPSDFRKIVRFRNAMKQKAIERKNDNLTDLSCFSGYFDQSHMIKDFKALTAFTPREFFKKLQSSHEGKISWIFPGQS